MAMEIQSYQHESGANFRIQFDIIVPPPAVVVPKGTFKPYAPKPQFRVNGIRIAEIDGQLRKKAVQFDRSYDSLAAARSQAGEYAKRIVRENMIAKPAAQTEPAEPTVDSVETPGG